MAEIETPPEPQRSLITTRKEYLDAVERLFGMVKRELRIFDPDLSELDFNSRNRIAALRRVLSGGRMHRVYIAVHDVEHVTQRCPRLIELLLIFPSGLLIYRTEGEAARGQDRFVLGDKSRALVDVQRTHHAYGAAPQNNVIIFLFGHGSPSGRAIECPLSKAKG